MTEKRVQLAIGEKCEPDIIKTMSNSVLPDPEDQRIAELENQLAQANATSGILQEQLRQQQAEVGDPKRARKRQATPISPLYWVTC